MINPCCMLQKSSFMKKLKTICGLDTIENIITILENYKKNTLQYDDTIDKKKKLS
jgi:hypothetical protein